MNETRILDDDVVKFRGAPKTPKDAEDAKERLIATLFWGDSVRLVGKEGGRFRFELSRREWREDLKRFETRAYTGLLPSKARFRDSRILKVRFVDVGQGDGAIVESPSEQIVLIDGGEESHLRNYVNVAYSHVLRTKPLHCEAIVVTHGDADHFAGLTEIASASRKQGSPLVTASRVFHNGLVKGPSNLGTAIFGKTKKKDGRTWAVELEDDLRNVADTRMNKPFRDWKAALKRLATGSGGLRVRRLAWGDDSAFDFLATDGIRVQVLGPIVKPVDGKDALPFLRTPGSSSLSASHTINGHSIVLRLTYGNVRFLFGADLNAESEESLVEAASHAGLSLASEILKVPHHGSADFSPRILESVRPVVSVISSGDESTAKEYIHPRAGLVGALGKYSRANVEKPLLYVTEMVAFFKRLEKVQTIPRAGANGPVPIHNAYQKTQFGIVHVRTDGERVLVATNSGKDDLKESYVFRVNTQGEVAFSEPSIP